MRTHFVVVPPPCFDDHLRLGARPKPFEAQTLVAKLAVEAFRDAILPRLAGFDQCRADALRDDPRQQSLGYELRPIIAAQKRRGAACADQARQHLDDAGGANAAIEVDCPLVELAPPPVSDVFRRISEQAAGMVGDGDCLQIGIGGMPNAVCAVLKDAGIRDLGVHTEMFVDGMVDLVEAGVVTGARKALNPYQIVFTFAAGSRRTYDFIDRNPGAQSFPVDYTNLPENIMRNPRVVSINNTTQVDLQGQAASESDGHRHLTGTGGQLQFVRGAYASNGGKAFICLASTYEKGGQRRSRIVSSPTPGNIVTTPRTDVMYVVTEYGLVNLKGKSVAERAKALISLAHPDFREQLAREAREHKLVPRAFW